VTSVPETRYAWNGDVALAYQVLGAGSTDLLYLQGWTSHVDMAWDSPHLAGFLRGLARTSRLIHTDRRGWGCSDRFSPTDVPPFETLSDDILAVMDAAGSERAAIFASMECAPIAMLHAASHPQRTTALILCDPYVTYVATEETPWMDTRADWEQWFDDVRRQYPLPRWWEGSPDDRERVWFDRLIRASVSPGSLISEFRRFLDTDVRPVMSSVLVPTLVLVDADGEEDVDPRNGRLIADRVPGARLVEMRAERSLNWLHWYGRGEEIVRQTGRFLADVDHQEATLDRVLATVLFTDLVDSTHKAAALGDRAWRDLVERHNATFRTLLARFRGTEVDSAGDGFFATFDGPARAVQCARTLIEALRPLGLEIRAGVHTGEVERIDGAAGGIAVVIGARVAAMANASEVLVTSTVKDLTAGSGLVFEDTGQHDLKGVPGPWHVYRLARPT
jgi:class 3 adenylate cyclase